MDAGRGRDRIHALAAGEAHWIDIHACGAQLLLLARGIGVSTQISQTCKRVLYSCDLIYYKTETHPQLIFLSSLYSSSIIQINHFLFAFRLTQFGMCFAAGSGLNFLPQPGHSTLSSSSGRGAGGALLSPFFYWLPAFIAFMAFLNLLLSFFHFGMPLLSFFSAFSSFFSCIASSSTTLTLKTLRLTSPLLHRRTCFSRAFSLNFLPHPSGHSTKTTSSNYGGSSLISFASFGIIASFFGFEND